MKNNYKSVWSQQRNFAGLLQLMVLFLTMGLSTLSGFSQTTVTIGTGVLTAQGTNGTPIYRSSATSAFHHSKSIQLVTAADMAAAGVPGGAIITQWGYNKTTAATISGANSWTMNVYLKNSSATALVSGTSWSTMITGASLAYSATINSGNFPAVAGYWLWPVSGFVYAGGAVECYVEWFPAGAMVSPFTSAAFPWQYTTTATAQAMGTSNSVAIAGTQSAWTTQARIYNTRLSYLPGAANDAGLQAVATPNGANTLCNSSSTTVSVTLKNAGSAAIDFSIDPLTVSSSVTGPNPATFSPVVINSGTLAAGATQVVQIAVGYDATLSGTYNFSASLSWGPDGFAGNNTFNWSASSANSVVASSNVYSFCDGAIPQLTTNVSSNYVVTSIAHAPITPVSPSAGPTGDDAIMANVPIPFPFTFYGNVFNSLNISTNGYVELGTNSAANVYGSVMPNVATPNNVIALAWEDGNVTTGNIQYFTSGTAPNRKFVIAWTNVFFFSATGNITGQIVLNEVDNTVDIFHTNVTQTGNFSVCGIENATGTAAVVPAGRQFGAWTPDPTTNQGWHFALPTITYSWSPTSGLSDPSIANPTATVPSGTSQIYTVTTTNSLTGCVISDTVSLTNLGAGDPAPITTSAAACAGASATLSASGLSTLNWWTAPVGGTIAFTGSTWNNTWASTTTYYVESNNGICPSARTPVTITVTPQPVINPTATPADFCLGSTTQLAANNFINGTLTTPLLGGNGASGVAFNVTASSTITLHYISTVITPVTGTVGIYILPGGFATPTVGSLAGWTTLTTTAPIVSTAPPTFTCAPNCVVTQIGYDLNLTIPAGQTYGIALQLLTGAATWTYTTSATPFGSVLASDPNLSIFVGAGGGGGSWLNSPRAFNGAISYDFGDPNLTFNWSQTVGTGSISNPAIANPTATPTSSGTNTYQLIAVNAANCSTTVAVNATANPLPADANTIAATNTFCGCGVANLTVVLPTVGSDVRWYTVATGGTSIGTGTPFNAPSACGPVTYYAEAFDPISGCVQSGPRASFTFTPTAGPAVTVSATDLNLCDGDPASTITAISSNDPNYAYTWNPTTGLTNISNGVVSALPSVTTTYTVSGFDAGSGCLEQAVITIGVGVTPTIAGATATPAAYCEGGSSQLNVSAFGGGSLPPAPGGYPANGGTITADEDIDAVVFGSLSNIQAPGLCALYTDYTGLTAPIVNAGQSVPFSITIGDCENSGFFSSGTSVFIDYNRDGDFNDAGELAYTTSATTNGIHTLSGNIVISNFASTGYTRMRIINAEGIVSPTFNQIYSYGETEDYTVGIQGGSSLSYLWSPATGLSSTTIGNPIANPTTSQNYTVTVSDAGGCSASTSVPVTVVAPPAPPTITDGTRCGPGIVNLSALGAGGTILWLDTIGGPILATGNNYSPAVTSTQTYYVIENPSAVAANVGLSATALGTTAFASAAANYQTFNVLSPRGIIINTVDIVPNPLTPLGTAIAIQLEDAAGNPLGAPVSTVTTTQGTVQTITLDMFVPQGTAYRLRPVSNPNLQYHQSGFVNPYTIPGQVSITGWGGPNATTLYVFFYNWSVSTFDGVSAGCYSAPSIATATVTPPPPLAILTPTGTSYCDAGTVILDGMLASDPSYVNFSWSPATGLNTTNGSIVFASPSVTTTYTLTADDGAPNGCSNTATVTVTVNNGPSVSIDPAPLDSLCSGASFAINATSGSSSFKQVGAGTNSTNNTIAIYDGNNSNVKTQVLYTAAELNAAGLVGPGNITSAAFNVVNKLSTTPLTGFTMRMANVATAPPLTATYLNPVFTTVFTGSVSTVLGWNQHVFTTPFFWDGTSNVILEVCNGTPGVPGFDQVQSTPTPTAQTIIANLLGCTSLTGAVNLNRPNTRFTGGAVTYSWAPAGELSASNIEDPTFTATADGAKSLVLTVTDPANGCTASATLNFTISGTPKAPLVATSASTAICNSGTVLIVASGTTGSYQWETSSDNLAWSDIVGETNDSLTVTISSDTYIRVKASCTNDAFSNSIFFDVTAPAVPVGTGATVCGQGNVSLSATVDPGLFDVWYDAPTGGNFIQVGSPLNVFVNTTTTYYVAASVAPIGAPGPPPTGYPASAATSTIDEDITAVTIGSLVNNQPAPNCATYTDYTGLTAHIAAPGDVVPFSISIGDCENGGFFSSGTSIFVDFNRDGDFADAGEQAYTTLVTTNGLHTLTGSFTVPLSASVGFTRVRIINVENIASPVYNQVYTYGETEDYLLQIGNTVCQSARVPVVATVTTPPALTISPASATICEGDSILLSDANGNYPGNYSWNPALSIINAADGSAYAAPVVTTEYILNGNDGVCANADTVVVTVNPNPVFTVSTPTPNICNGDTVDLNALISSPLAGVYTVSGIPFAPDASALTQSGPALNDEGNIDVPLPFTFNFGGVDYTGVTIHANGQILMGTGNTSADFVYSPPTIFSASAPNNWVGFWSDLNVPTAGSITYDVVGAAPNRKLIVKFTNVDFYFATPAVTYQIELNETSNNVDVFLTSVNGITNTKAIGLETGSAGYFAPGRNSGTWTAANEAWRFSPSPAPSISWTGQNIITPTNTASIQAVPSASGYYVVTVTNPLTGCAKSDSVQVNFAISPTPFMVQNDTTLCNPAQIDISVADAGVYSGGYPGGTQFTWSAIGVPIVDLDSINSSYGSSYSVIVTLPNGCNASSDTITVLTKSVAVVDVITNSSCVGGGSVSVTVTSGLADYNFVWSTDLAQTNIVRNVTKTSNQDTLANLAAGTYYLQVYDEAGTPASCNSGVLTYVVGGSSSIVASVTPTDITCNGNANGAADVTWTGGNAPFSITWSDGNFANTTPRTIAVGGNYSVIVSDLSGCADTVAFTIVEPLPVTVTFTSTPESFPGALDGTVTAIPAGGTGPYSVQWADELFVTVGSGNPLTGLAAGLYYGLVTDANLCDNSATVLGDSIRVDVITNATLNLKLIIEGYYDGLGGMTPALLNAGVGLSATEVDTIVVELRDALSPSSIVQSATVVLNTNDSAMITLPGSVIGNSYYIAVFHRNAVQTWSDLPVTFAGVTNYDFTTAATQAFGSNMIAVAPGVFAFYSGDIAPQDEVVDITDQGYVGNDILNFAAGYVPTDVSGDGVVDITDQAIVDNNIINFVGSIHP